MQYVNRAMQVEGETCSSLLVEGAYTWRWHRRLSRALAVWEIVPSFGLPDHFSDCSSDQRSYLAWQSWLRSSLSQGAPCQKGLWSTGTAKKHLLWLVFVFELVCSSPPHLFSKSWWLEPDLVFIRGCLQGQKLDLKGMKRHLQSSISKGCLGVCTTPALLRAGIMYTLAGCKSKAGTEKILPHAFLFVDVRTFGLFHAFLYFLALACSWWFWALLFPSTATSQSCHYLCCGQAENSSRGNV